MKSSYEKQMTSTSPFSNMSLVLLCSASESNVVRTSPRTDLTAIWWPFQAPFWAWSKDGITQRERDQGTWSQVLSPSSWHHLSTRFKNHWSMLTSKSCWRHLKTVCKGNCLHLCPLVRQIVLKTSKPFTPHILHEAHSTYRKVPSKNSTIRQKITDWHIFIYCDYQILSQTTRKKSKPGCIFPLCHGATFRYLMCALGDLRCCSFHPCTDAAATLRVGWNTWQYQPGNLAVARDSSVFMVKDIVLFI